MCPLHGIDVYDLVIKGSRQMTLFPGGLHSKMLHLREKEMVKLLPQAMFTSRMVSEKIKFAIHHNFCLVSSTDQKCA